MEAGEKQLPVGVVTLLLTDVDRGAMPPEALGSSRELDALTNDVIAKFDGVRPPGAGGGGLMAAFVRPSDALACALEIQRMPITRPARLRIALHTGEVDVSDGTRYDAPTVVRATRLRDLAHGGQVLVSSATRDLVLDRMPRDAELVDLGSHLLKDLDRPERVYQLVHPDLPRGFPALTSLDAARSTLPVRLTSFIGRDSELDGVGQLVREHHVVTLTGAGGCGKTRLAVETAVRLNDAFSDGIWFCDLAPLSTPDAVASTLRTTIGVAEDAARTDVDAVCAHLAESVALIVLDNCEHLVEASANVVDAIFAGCPRVHVLATSREPLSVHGEVTWRVPSLDLPPPDADLTLDALTSYDAIRLFVERAEHARRAFELSSDNASAVREICTRLDGIPLAIELAAARVRVLSVQDIAEGLNDRFRLLGRGARTVVARHQTLLASVGWSHDLLTEPQRAVLRRSSVFAGGMTLEAVENVVAGADVRPSEVLEVVSQLVDRSLLVVEESSVGTRYRMLETIRQYARDRLVEAGEGAATSERHLEWFAGWAQGMLLRAERDDPELLDVLDLFEPDYDNIRAACDWALAEGRHELGLRLVAPLSRLWISRPTIARSREGLAWLTELLRATEDVSASARVGGLVALVGSLDVGDLDLTAAAAREAQALARTMGDERLLGHATLLGIATGYHAPNEGLRQLEECIELSRRAGDLITLRLALFAFVQLSGYSGRRAVAAAREAVELSGERSGAAGFARACLGHSLFNTGHVTAGYAEMLRALQTFELEGNLNWYSLVQGTLARIESLRGDRERARARAEDSVSAVARDTGWDMIAVQNLSDRGSIALEDGDLDRAEQDLETIAEFFAEVPGPIFLSYRAEALAMLAVARVGQARVNEVRALVDEAVAVAHEDGFPLYVVNAFWCCARVARALGELSEAEAHVNSALSIGFDRGCFVLVPDVLDVAATIRADVGADVDSVRLLAAAHAARERMEIVRRPDPIWDADAELAALRSRVGEDRFEKAWTAGTALSTEDAISYALRGRGPRQRPQSGWDSLTPTELKVVELAAAGLNNPQIAERLFISRRTVSTHLSHVFAKLGLSSRTELAAEAAKRGI